MGEVTTVARGWTADWLNGWLAAIGATVVVDGLRLSWTEVPRPAAVLHHDSDPAEAIYEALPTEAALQASATARSVDGLPEFDRNYPAAVFAARAAYARRVGDWSLGPASTDLVLPRKAGGDLEHGPFDVPAPQGITLHDRVVACRAEITELDAVAASMAGTPDLAQMNGLGFDARRMEPGTLAKPVLDGETDPSRCLPMVVLAPTHGPMGHRRLARPAPSNPDMGVGPLRAQGQQ
jgi:hypothetical protein